MTARSGAGLWLQALLIVLAIAFIALGSWQIQRLFWKRELIAQVEARIAAAAIAPPPADAWSGIGPADAYRRIRLDGRFLHDRETLVQAVTERGPGFWVLTPLVTGDGTTVVVNRGFVPPDRRHRSTRQAGLTEGVVDVEGLLRLSEAGGAFLRSNDPGKDRWFSRDVSAIARARGLSLVAPFFIDADARPNAGGFPVGGLTVVRFPNSHFAYALTWYAMAALAGVAVVIVRRARRRDG